MKILIGLFLSLNIYSLQAQHAYDDAVRIKNFIQFIPKSTPAKDSIALIDTLFNMGNMVSETNSPALKDSILSILSKYYAADSLESVLDSNSILFNPYLSHLGPYLFTYSRTTWPTLNKVVTQKYINTLGGYQFNMDEPGIDFSSFKTSGVEYSKLVYTSWFNYLSQSANPRLLLAYLNLVQSISAKPDHEKYIGALLPKTKKYVDQDKDPSKWSTDLQIIKGAIKKDQVHINANLNSSNRLHPGHLHPDEVDHLFNLLQKDIHDLKKSYGLDEINQVVINGLQQGSESFRFQRMLSLGVLILSLTNPTSGGTSENLNDLKEGEVHKIYLGLVYAGLNKMLTSNEGL